ncbi:GFA family protein [Microbulbifer marinus]|uniref:Uncharacterized conserved protein n=1 Tax=Microbulbifer marinus TaxID=658218 RepID=A0A1H3VLA2_9GAMM|nr:GFA family protein [Microbulbifer marinus]SDZ75566.1 Uncharacterized conserved protein [Microbulbifer marinus]
MPLLSGGCACGKVRYECSEKPIVQLICHCRDCQHASGAAFAATMFVPADRLEYKIDTELHFYDVQAESGRTLRRNSCGECGSPISAHWPDMPGVVLLAVGGLDDQSVFEPTHEVWVSRAEAWHPFLPHTVKLDEGPTDDVVRDPLRAYFSSRRG